MEFERNGRPRVVVTGFGAVSPYGNAFEMWNSFLDSESCITRINQAWASHVPVGIAGQVGNFDPLQYLSKKEARRISRPSQFAIATADQAATHAGYEPEKLNPERVGVVMGTTMGPHLLSEEMITRYRGNGHRRPNPVLFANCLPNMPAHFVSQRLQALGPLAAPSAACATGTQAIGDGTALIRSGRADMMFVGGVEAIIQDYIIAGFASMSALAEGFENCPTEASRPFEANRNGFVLTEGAALLVLESLGHAIQRGATIYAEIMGHASCADAHHITAIEPEAQGMQRVMRWALEDANLAPLDIDYINAHGTGTPSNDRLETHAIKQVFGNHAYTIAVSSVKSMLGHAMAAAGALEAIAAILTLNEQRVPPTINYYTPDPECDLDYVPHEARQVTGLRYALSNNFGLGGQNASVIFGKV